MVIKCLCFDGVKNSENCTFRFRKLYVSFSRLYGFVDFDEAVQQFRVVVAVKRGYSEPVPYRFGGHTLAERDRLGGIVDHAQGDLLSGCGPGRETEDGEK